MKTVTLSPTLVQQCWPAVEDAIANVSDDNRPRDPSDPVYLKISYGKRAKNGGIEIEVTDDELAELISRFDFEIETCHENIADTSDRSEKGYWLARLRAAQCFIKKYR